MIRKPLIAGIWALAAVAALAPVTQAQTTYTWDGGANPDGNWSNVANWTGPVPVSDAANSLVDLAGTTNLNTTLDLLSGSGGGSFDVNRLRFLENAGSFAVNPTAANVTTLRIGLGGMLISNANPQTIAVPINLSASQTWTLAGTTPVVWTNPQSTGNPPVFQQITSFRPSRLTVTGNVDVGVGNTLTVNVNSPTNFPAPNPYFSFDATYAGTTLQINNLPPGEARINGTVSNGGITKTGAGVLTLNGLTTPTGAVSTNGGALAINRSTVGASPFGAGTVTLGGGALSFRRVASPLAINAAGFNHDVISSASDSIADNPFGTSIALDNTEASNDGWVLYEVGNGVSNGNVNPGFQTSGLPPGGLITGFHNTLATYQLQPYGLNGVRSNNALQLQAVDGNEKTLTLTTPGQFSTISVLNTAGGGQGNYTARLIFNNDPTNFTDVNVNSPDWFNVTPLVISGLGRFNRLDGRFENQVNNPRLYATDIHLSAADQIKNLTSVRFTRTGGGTLNIFGLSGYATDAAAPTSYTNAINVTASSTIEMWATPTLTLGPLSIGGQTLTTIAGGVTTLNFPSTSVTGNATFNIFTDQTFNPGPINFNSATRNFTKAGNGLMNLNQPAVNATVINRLTVNAGTAAVSNITSLGNTPNLTVGGGTANLGPYTTLNSVTTTGGTANLPNVTSLLLASTSLTASGGTTNFTPHVTMPTATVTGGTVNFPGGTTIAGLTTVNGGTVNIGAASSVGRLDGLGGTVALGGNTLRLGSSNLNAAFSGGITGATGSIIKEGSATQTLASPASTFGGGTTVSAGTLAAARPGSLGTGPVNLQNNTTLSVGGIPGASIMGFGINGTGWTLNGGPAVANDLLTITTNANNQTRSAFFNTKQPTTAFTASFDYIRGPEGSADPADGAAFAIQNQAVTAVGGGGGSLGYAGLNPARGLAINIFNSNTRGISVRINGTVPPGGNPPPAGGYTPVDPVSLLNSSAAPVRFNLVYDGTNLNVSLTQGTNSFNLAPVAWTLGGLGADAWVGFTGATGGLNSAQRITNFLFNVTGGPLLPPVSTYTNAVNIDAGATVGIRPKVAAGGVTTFTMGALSVGSAATVNVQPDVGSLADTAYDLTLGATTLNGPATINVVNNGTGVGSLALGALNGGATARAITKGGTGTLVLTSGANLVDGSTVSVDAGTLRSNHATGLGALTAVTVAPGANLSLGASQTVGALNGAGTAALNGNTLTVGSTNNLSSVFAGVIADGTGPGGLTKAGTGTLTLNGVNTYTGTTAVNAGTLNGSGTIAGPVNLNDGGTIQGGTGGSTTASNTLSLPGGLQLDGANNVLVVVGDTNQGNGQADPTSSRLDLGAGVLSRNTGGAVDLTTIRVSAVPMSLDAFQQYTVMVATFGSSSNLTVMDFTVDPNPTGFVFAEVPFLTLNGTNLTLTFSPTPEPGAVLGLSVLAGLAAAGLRRRLGRLVAKGADRTRVETVTGLSA